MNPSKYMIVNEDFPESNQEAESKPVSPYDQASNQEYYPSTRLDERTAELEKNARDAIRSRRDAGKEYSNDPNPYYGADYIKKFQPIYARDSMIVPVDLRDVSKTFPTTKNLRMLEARLKFLLNCPGKRNCDVGVYEYDKNAYYDPTEGNRLREIELLRRKINEMNESLRNNYQPDLMFEKESFRPKIQNPQNSDREVTNKFVAESYFYPVNRTKVANGTIEYMSSSNGLLVKSKYIDNDKNIIETADSVGDVEGNNNLPYYTGGKGIKVVSNNLSRPMDQNYQYADGKIIYSNGHIQQNVNTAVKFALGKVVTNGNDLLARKESSEDRQVSDSVADVNLNLNKQNESTTPDTNMHVAAPNQEAVTKSKTSETLAQPKLEAVSSSASTTSQRVSKVEEKLRTQNNLSSDKPKIELGINVNPSQILDPSKSDEKTINKDLVKSESIVQPTRGIQARVNEIISELDSNTVSEKKTEQTPSKDAKLVQETKVLKF